MPVTIEVEEKIVTYCVYGYNYTPTTKRFESQTVKVDNQGFGKLQLNFFPYDTNLKVMVSVL